MNAYHIYLNGKVYGGEDPDASEAIDMGGAIGRTYNQGVVDVLRWGDEPYTIHGMTGLASHIDRILRRVRAGRLQLERLEIVLAPPPHTAETADVAR